METGPWLKVSSDKLVKPGIEPATPCLQGKRFIYYTTAAPNLQCRRRYKVKVDLHSPTTDPVAFNIGLILSNK